MNSFDNWMIKAKALLALTEIDEVDFIILESYFKQNYTPEFAANNYKKIRMGETNENICKR